MPLLLRIYVGCAAVLYGDYHNADLVKIHIGSGKVSLMRYDDFEGEALPRMIERVKIKLREQDIDYFGMIRLTYGFCSPELAKEIPGRIDPKRDQHAGHELNRLDNPVCEGLDAAVDFIVEDESMLEVAQWIVANTPFDRLYFYGDNQPIHVSHGPEQVRQVVCMANEDIYRLPQPAGEQEACLSRILEARRTIRSFAPRPLSQIQVAQLLWAAQGVASPEGYRTAPSAGALYPLELHLVAGNVEGLPAGSYRYDPARHALRAAVPGDIRRAIAEAALSQSWIARAAAVVVISAIESRTTTKYGRRGARYVHMEVGHASQNLLLQAVALGLAGAIVGAFDDERLQRLLQLPREERPLAILPIGHPLSEASLGQ